MNVQLSVRGYPSGQNLKGIVTLDVTAKPNPQNGVKFNVGATLIATDTSAPYSAAFNTTTLADGPYTLYAVADYGTKSSIAQLPITVSNTATPPPPPPPSTNRIWPSSFMTGPLGANNILPTSTSGVFLAAMFGGLGYTMTEKKTQIVNRQAAMGRRYDVLHSHYDGSLTQTWPADTYGPDTVAVETPFYWVTELGMTQEAYAKANGSEFAVTWTPDYSITNINNGAADAVWTKMANYWKTLAPQRIMLRVFHEFDLPGRTYGVRSNSAITVTGTQFITAWRRMVSKFQAAGASNVGFWWCPFEGSDFTDLGFNNWSKQAEYYPGDAYVDWVGSDIYNVCLTAAEYCSPGFAGWAPWARLFNYGAFSGSSWWSDYDIYGSGVAVSGQRGVTLPAGLPTKKPFMIGETGVRWDPNNPTFKATWYPRILSDALGIKSMPNCIGISFFDCDVTGAHMSPPINAGDYNYMVDYAGVQNVSDPACLNGFVTMAKDPYFIGK